MVRALALVLTVVTGASGLVYEITWQKYLAILLGSHSEATAAVLGIFLGGLSLGYLLFGSLTQRLYVAAARSGRPPKLLAAYGLIEALIGLYAFVFPALFSVAQSVSGWLPVDGSAIAFLFDVLLAAVLIGPPSVLMGGTIPILTQALARNLDDATRFHALVYALNTAGAFIGALAAGFWLIPTLGLVGVLDTVGWLNVLAGVSFMALGLLPAAKSPVVEAGSGRASIDRYRIYAVISLLVGFGMMTIQTVFIRLGGLSLGSSHFTFAMVVAVFVLCIALGSIAVSALRRIPPAAIVANLWVLVAILILLYPFLGDGPYWAHALRSLFRDHTAGFYPFYANVFAGLLAILGIPVMLSGAVLPLLFHHLRGQVGDLGAVAGRLYGWNTLGSLLGALLGGYLLFYWLDLDAIYRVAIASLVAASVAVSLLILPTRRRVWVAALVVPAIVSLLSLSSWDPKRLYSGTFRYRRPMATTFAGADAYFEQLDDIEVRFFDDGPAVSAAVIDHSFEGKRSLAIVTNGKPDGSIGIDYTTMAMAALLPAVLAERVERAFVIGYGTGVTVGEFAALDSIEEVVVAEISRGVIEAAPLFDPYNMRASVSPKVSIIRADAYRALLHSRGNFDIIVSEPSNPWVTGIEMLYSQEFLETAHSRLNPGGVYVQWFHIYETDDRTISTVLNTYTSVFESVAVWNALGGDFLLIGFAADGEKAGLDRITKRARQPDIAEGLARCGIDNVPELLAHELVPRDVIHTLELGEQVHTLLHPILSDLAARAFFRGGSGGLPSQAHLRSAELSSRSSLIREFALRAGGQLTRRAHRRFAAETCEHRPEECAVVLAEWLARDPDSEAGLRLLKNSRRRAEYRGVLNRVTIQSLIDLFDASRASGRSVSLAEARRATNTFARFYHHAAPFDRGALLALWEACARDPDREPDCLTGLESAERKLGDLRAEQAGSQTPHTNTSAPNL
ncbi:MAG: fused MFS/spermidine synthase [Myxococcota bacterium]